MKPFRFRLETLLNFRKIQKEEAQIAFLQASNELRTEKEKLADFKARLVENIILLQELQQQALSIEMFKSFQYYFDKINIDIIQQSQVILKKEEHCRLCLQALAEAERNYKIVEKFREKKIAHYHFEAMAEEQKILDEIGLQIYTREK